MVAERQKRGALAVLTLCLFYYGFSLLETPFGRISRSPVPFGDQGEGRVAIEVRGGRAEGVYFMPKGTTLDRIENVAGIPAAGNGALRPDWVIPDGVLFEVSPEGDLTLGEMSAAKKLALGIRIDLNRASEGDLTLVPGISDRMAAEIVQLRTAKREFRDLSDLLAVPGIKEKRLSGLRDYLTVGREH